MSILVDMNFFNAFWKPSFYKNKTSERTLLSAFLRLIVVSVCVGMVYALLFYIKIGKDIPAALDSFETKIVDGYPADLTLSVKDKKLLKNIPGEIKLYPVSIFGETIRNQFEKDISHFIVINEAKEATLTSFKESGAVVFLAKDGFIVQSDNETKIGSYEGFGQMAKDSTFTKSMLTSFFGVLDEYIPYIPTTLTVAIIVLYTLLAPFANAFYLLFVGLIVMFFGIHILKRKVDYPEAYIVSMYALPSIIIIEALLSYIPYVSSAVSYIPFFTTIGVVAFLQYMHRGDVSVAEQEVIA